MTTQLADFALLHGCRAIGTRPAISVGLRKRDPGPVMQDFIDDIKPAVVACGLQFPPLEKIGIVAPAGLDLSTDGVDVTRAEGYLARS